MTCGAPVDRPGHADMIPPGQTAEISGACAGGFCIRNEMSGGIKAAKDYTAGKGPEGNCAVPVYVL